LITGVAMSAWTNRPIVTPAEPQRASSSDFTTLIQKSPPPPPTSSG
jgi:hypothetical protein